MAKNTKKVQTKVKKKNKIDFSEIKQKFKKKKKTTAKVNMEIKKKKKKQSKHILLIIFMIMLILGSLACLGFATFIIVKAPEFDVKRLYKSSSSIIYDADMNIIAELGIEKRENITYDDLPDILVDAIVATEDSKFFQHSGIDLLRFSKAVIGQLMGRSDAGGGSTLTMQIVKNTYSGTISTGIKGIIRKFTDIYMAVFKVEKTYTKQQIIEFYVNQAYMGSGAYGIEQASQTYFGKSVGELNLSEAAMLAGLFQAPSAYDPYIYPEKAQARRNMVLNLMVRHGYITAEEAQVARAIEVKDMLSGYNYSYSQYQGFIDTLIVDVYNKTGMDPAVTSMTIYTTLDTSKQKVINNLYKNGTDKTIGDNISYTWKNDVVQCGIAVTDVETGAVVAIGTGRNRTGERQLNYATSIKRHPGSTAKPIFDYGPAIEYEGWGTGTTVVDDEYYYSTGGKINNVDYGYQGILTAKKALANSRNVTALQAFQATTQEDKYEFVTNLGITPELHSGKILESSSIGAFNGVSPLELSAAYGTFARGGYYIEPYTFTKIIFNDTDETYTHTPTKSKAMSTETAYMINMMLKYAVTSGAIGVGSVSGDVASKTGTTSVDRTLAKKLGLSSSAVNDVWQVSYSPDYSIAFWYGYDTLTKSNYLTSTEGWNARKAIVKALTPNIITKGSKWTKPKGVVAVDIELETNPVQLASEFTPDNMRSTEYFRKGTEPTEVSTRFMQLSNVSNLTYTSVGNQVQLSWTPIDTPDAIDDTYLLNYYNESFPKWSEKYYNKRLEYNAEKIGVLTYHIYVKNDDGTLSYLDMTTASTYTTTLTNSTTATFVVKSAYSIFKDNASSGREITVKITPSFTPIEPNDGNGEGNTENDVENNNTDNGNENTDNNNESTENTNNNQ